MVAILSLALASCEADLAMEPDGPVSDKDNVWKTCPLRVNLSLGEPHTRSPWELKDGDMMSLALFMPHSTVRGYALYDATTSTWMFCYGGHLEECLDQSCSLKYMSGPKDCIFYEYDPDYPPEFPDDYKWNLYPETAVFGLSQSASFSYVNGGIDLTATLTPEFLRMKFINAAGADSFQIRGVCTPAYFGIYDINVGLRSCAETLELSVEPVYRGYETLYESPYIYWTFDDNSEYLRLKNSSGVYLLKERFSWSNLKNGGSYTIDYPSDSFNARQWIRDRYVNKTLPDSHTGFTSGNISSKVGCILSFDYVIKSVEADKNPVLRVIIEATNANGDTWRTTYTYGTDNLHPGEMYHDDKFNYQEGFDTYGVTVIVENMEIEMTNISLSNF